MLTITLVIGLMMALGLLYWFPIRKWFNSWGTTPGEVAGVMPGDKVIAHPTNRAMQAITVNTNPENIWPWLVQMGYQRGGMYSYDWLDRLFGFLDRPSTSRVLPEYQHLSVGDKIPWGHGEYLIVNSIEPYKSLVLDYQGHGMEWVWQFLLSPLDVQHTRLVTRGIERTPQTLFWRLAMILTEPAAFIMTRRMLLGVKQRAEALGHKTKVDYLTVGQPGL